MSQAEEEYLEFIKFNREINRGSIDELTGAASILGRNMLESDLGRFEKDVTDLKRYDLDEQTRDRLLAHSRQDIAMIYDISVSNLKISWMIRRILVIFLIISLVLNAVLIFIFLKSGGLV